MIEAQVHSYLRNFLREHEQPHWPHHLTMARLVARALRLGRPALLQTGSSSERYALSYLATALLWHGPVLVVTSPREQQRLVQTLIPSLKSVIATDKEIYCGDRWPENPDFRGLMLTSSFNWLEDRLQDLGRFPAQLPTLIDQADDLEEIAQQQLTHSWGIQEWEELRSRYPHQGELIRDVRVKLTSTIFRHPANPYECYLLEPLERVSLRNLLSTLEQEDSLQKLPTTIKQFWRRWQNTNQIAWASLTREKGIFTLHIAPGSVAPELSRVWTQQPFVLMGRALDRCKEAHTYRQKVGLKMDLTCLKFSPNRREDCLSLYLPERLPMPNTPQYRQALLSQVYHLVTLNRNQGRPTVLIIGDVPLKAQVGATLAAEFGSRVQVEKREEARSKEGLILVTGWQFWRDHQHYFPSPQLLIIATLPLPSLENPLVAGKVAHYKRFRQDWFRLYLLPEAMKELQRAIVPVRESQGSVALLDNRVNHRSYGKRILTALEPFARINYLDEEWLF